MGGRGWRVDAVTEGTGGVWCFDRLVGCLYRLEEYFRGSWG
jgi:hypothetical protein